MAKLLKLRRGTTSQHGTFTGAEGEVTVDLNKDTLVVHDGTTQSGHTLLREDLSNIGTGVITQPMLGNSSVVAAKVANDAIGDPQLSDHSSDDAFRAVGTNHIKSNAVTLAKIEDFATSRIMGRVSGGTGDASQLTAANVRSIINVEDGATADQSNTEIKSAYEANSNTNALTDTLLTKLNGIDTGAKDDQTKAEIDALNINADTLDTLHASSFIRSDADDTISESNQVRFSCAGNIPTVTGSQAALEVYSGNGVGTDAFMSFHTSGDYALYFGLDGGTNDLAVGGWSKGANSYRVWHAGNDGVNSGLDADLLDGKHDTSFLRSDAGGGSDSYEADLGITFKGGNGAVTIAANSDIRAATGSWSGETSGKIQHHSDNWYFQNAGGNWLFRNPSGDNKFSVDSSGNAIAEGNVTAYSDVRLKTDIHTINDALGICGKLRGVSYKWIKDGKPSIGVIAQEIEEVLPEVVLTQQVLDSTGEKEVKSVDYGKIVGVLINAINELKAEVDELKGGK